MGNTNATESPESKDALSITLTAARQFLGCLSMTLLLVFSPVLMIAFSNYVHVAGLAVAGLLLWFLVARWSGRKMLDRKLALPGVLLLAGLVILGLMMLVVGFLPCPPWCSRKVVKNADYRAMARIFDHPLPPSFRITQVYYPGYNLVFNGPDGPASAAYEAVMGKNDYAALMSGASKAEVTSEIRDWLTFTRQSRDILKRFGNDWPDKLQQDYFGGKRPKPPKVYRVKCQGGEAPASSLVTVDDRASSTVRLYIYTRVPY